jgi:hypothetical protein
LNAASVQVPLTISWSATLSPSEISGGYNWQVSRSPSFSPLALADSTSPAITQDVVSGLPAGTYFWRVQAVDVVGQSPWSQLLARTRHHILIVGSVLVVNCDAEIVCATVKN